MERRNFISKGLAAGAIIPAAYATLISNEAQASEKLENRQNEAVAAALAAGTFPSNPKPNAETTTSARRLKFVFVDIDFLSLVVDKTFSSTAGRD